MAKLPLLTWIVALLIVALATYLAVLDYDHFGISFFSGLLCSTLILLLSSLALPKYLLYLRKPKLIISTIHDEVKKIDGKIFFSLTIINEGNDAVMSRVYWHLYVPTKLHPAMTVTSDKGVTGNLKRKEVNDYSLFRGEVSYQLYPKTGTEIHTVLSIDVTEDKNSFAIYYLSTELGTCPSNVDGYQNKLASPVIDFDKCSKLSLSHV